MGRLTVRVPTTRWDLSSGRTVTRPDTLAVEEPLEVRLDGRLVMTTMRTPGDDLELAIGWLLAEGVLHSPHDIAHGMHCTDLGPDGSPTFNVLELRTRPDALISWPQDRQPHAMTSACGVCGTAAIDELLARGGPDLSADPTTVDPHVLAELPERLRTAQAVFAKTGGLHAAGVFTAGGDLLVAREDVGRHNAADKVLGWAAKARDGALSGTVLQLSGRASFELVQKAWMAGVPVVAAVSAPSSLAVEVAERAGLTLAGFVREGRFTVYSRPDRVRPSESGPSQGDAGHSHGPR